MKAATKLFCFFIISIFSLQKSTAQTTSPYYHSLRKPGIPASTTTESTAKRSTGKSGTGANIDVIYQRCNWRINPDSSIKAIGGSVTFHFKTTQTNVSTISFDLNSVLTISNIRFRGANLPAGNIARSGHIVTVTLGATLANNFIDSFTVSYNGTPPGVSGQAEGYQSNKTKAFPVTNPPGGNYIYTLSESYEDRDWWPCKADMQDKIDSMDIFISVPNGFRVATNGKFVDSVSSGSSRLFHYSLQYPIPSYLVAVGVANYAIYDRGTVNIGGTNVPVLYYIFKGKSAGTYTSLLNALDFSKLELTAFSNKFGDYPFKKEKHGYYEFGWGGGMEHQSFSAMGSGVLSDWGTIAHELAHQWFGDKVTFATWNELWLAEGFARYSEALAAELVPSIGANAASVRAGFKSAAQGNAAYGCYIPTAQ